MKPIIVLLSMSLLSISCDRKLNEINTSSNSEREIALLIIEKYLNSIGGLSKIDSIESIEQQYTLTCMGYDLHAVTYKTLDGKYCHTQGSEYEPHFIQKFDGLTAYEKDPDGTITRYSEGKKYNQLVTLGKIFKQKEYRDKTFTLELPENLDNMVNGEECTVIRVKSQKGKDNLEYYGNNSGFLLKETSSMVNALDIEKEVVFLYSDYKLTNGIAFPNRILVSGLGHADYVLTAKRIKINHGIDESIFKI